MCAVTISMYKNYIFKNIISLKYTLNSDVSMEEGAESLLALCYDLNFYLGVCYFCLQIGGGGGKAKLTGNPPAKLHPILH